MFLKSANVSLPAPENRAQDGWHSQGDIVRVSTMLRETASQSVATVRVVVVRLQHGDVSEESLVANAVMRSAVSDPGTCYLFAYSWHTYVSGARGINRWMYDQLQDFAAWAYKRGVGLVRVCEAREMLPQVKDLTVGELASFIYVCDGDVATLTLAPGVCIPLTCSRARGYYPGFDVLTPIQGTKGVLYV